MARHLKNFNIKPIKHSVRYRNKSLVEQSYKCNFKDILLALKINEQQLTTILSKVINRNTHRIFDILTDDEYKLLKHHFFILASFGFQFKQISYFTLYQIPTSRIRKLVLAHKKLLLQRPVTIYLSEPLLKLLDNTNNSIFNDFDIRYLDFNSNDTFEDRISKSFNAIYNQEIVLFKLQSDTNITIDKAIQMKYQNRKKKVINILSPYNLTTPI